MEGPTAVFLAMIIIGLPVHADAIANRYSGCAKRSSRSKRPCSGKGRTICARSANWSSACGPRANRHRQRCANGFPDRGAASNRRAFLQGKRLHESLRVRPRDHRRHRHIFALRHRMGVRQHSDRPRRRRGKAENAMLRSRSTSSRIAFACSSASSPIAAPRLQRRSKRFVTTNASPRRNRPDGRRPAYGDLHRRDRDDRFDFPRQNPRTGDGTMAMTRPGARKTSGCARRSDS